MKLNDHHEDTMSTLDTAISALKSGLSGRLILPGDADYDAARAVMYGGMDFHPAAIAKVISSKDMQKVLAVSAENRIPTRWPDEVAAPTRWSRCCGCI